MYDSQFFQTKLGQAAIASIAAMVTFAALASQFDPAPVMAVAMPTDFAVVEIA